MLGHTPVPNWVATPAETNLPPLLKDGKQSAAGNSTGEKWHSLSPLLSPAFGESTHGLQEKNTYVPHPKPTAM